MLCIYARPYFWTANRTFPGNNSVPAGNVVRGNGIVYTCVLNVSIVHTYMYVLAM